GLCDYMGNMEISVAGSGMQLINHIYIEDYLYGVLPYEMPNSWELEALKAQAIAARSLAASWIKSNKEPYDVVDTVNNQVYKGYNAGAKRCIQAVNETSK